jgi:superfamily I DNA and/or RNA helicase
MQTFEIECCKAFQILRERAYVFINLLQLMLVADIEELKQKDIPTLIRAMLLDMSEEQAQSEFKKLIRQAVTEWYRKYDNWFHNYKDYTKGQR